MVSLVRALLFCLRCLPAEVAHRVTLMALDGAHRLGLLTGWQRRVPAHPVDVMGLTFPNPVGLAAGLDKNGEHIDALGSLGFGFVEIGTVTPQPQPGNPKPRLFRLPEHGAIINRMGFNNHGLEALVGNVRQSGYRGVLGINVGKNKSTPEDQAAGDYRAGIEAVYPCADYITVNVSSPNTPGLRDLQFGDALRDLLASVKAEQTRQQDKTGRYVPIAVKIAPDMDDAAIAFVADALLASGLDAVIATNTTVDRAAVKVHPLAGEAGGLSGRPVREPSLRMIHALRRHLGDQMPIIGVGGIEDGVSAREKIEAGASLVQIYTGLIYKGPALVQEAVEAIAGAGKK
ncbi:dihydroorotate dehydrogenase (quinone) [Tamilnaduibacter salinus]|uniref:Dihydroorotate dehydrogenase (quinone) n=1 Tax=Tamilnaduibacter salinus TaxID=1484056 RepID=A0A2A2I796_9GAMM|nr:quinone-dependent dihydroorotate dehydrogenase [Tamilnaduibacter salinus]PAV26990.1 dihydroorotate dehydrogenase (quinone) [Tamilnaduibacter salinus]